MQHTANGIPERNLGELLNETFAVYGRNFRSIIFLVAIIQVPISLVVQLASENAASIIVVGFVSVLGSSLVNGAVAFATGQSYFDNRIDVSRCYQRVGWRLISILMLGLFPAVVLGGFLGISRIQGDLAALVFFPALALLIYMVYWNIALPSIIFEGHKAVGALKRSNILLEGQWWRVFGLSLVFALVAFGLAILVSLPFGVAIVMITPEGESVNTLGIVLNYIGFTVTTVIVSPVMFIAATLMYYDLRVRKEGFDTERLSQDMGIGQA